MKIIFIQDQLQLQHSRIKKVSVVEEVQHKYINVYLFASLQSDINFISIQDFALQTFMK